MTERSASAPNIQPTHPIGGPRTVLPRPSWAEASTLQHDHIRPGDTTVVHTWTSPQESRVRSGGETGSVFVELTQTEVLTVADGGLTASPEQQPTIYLGWLDGHIDSTADARRLAAAIIECCDRLDGATD